MLRKTVKLIAILAIVLISANGIRGTTSHASPLPTVVDIPIEWTRLSSANGDLPEPSESLEQTSTLILDINKDNFLDFVISTRSAPGPSLVWYQRNSSGWTRHIIDDQVLNIVAGGAYHDIDADGDLDIVMGGNFRSNQIWWWENPYPNFGSTWIRREIKNSGANMHHDQIFGDFDGDGNTEFVFWNQGANSLFLADIPSDPLNTQPWSYTAIYTYSSGQQEGLAKADIDGDGVLDIVGGGRWFKHTTGDSYTANVVDDSKRFSRAAAGQLKPGGRPEIVFVAGDDTGPLDWYEWNGSSWTSNNLLASVDHGHSLEIADINGDGNLDIFVAEMRLNGGNPDASMWIFLGNGSGNFSETLIASGIGNHESKVGDLDGDGDLDILGKPFNWDTPRVDVWLNQSGSGSLPLDQWQRHLIDDDRPWRAIFITAADIDGDNLQDVITGAWWYKNPGADLSAGWTRNEFGSPLNNMAAVHDFDNDNDPDILGTTGQGSRASDTCVWAQNNGSGQFSILDNVSNGDGDFLQGVSVGRFQNGDLAAALSWHQGGRGVQLLTVPQDPLNQTWPWSQISQVSQDEALSSGDIDKDGDLDLLLGTKWLRNDGASWTAFDLYVPNGAPDRNQLADINGDGTLDAVVGYEAISLPGKLAWYEQGQDPTSLWTEHLIADPAIIGPMSLDVADMDADGDLDVVAGEHSTEDPASASLYVFENLDGSGLDWNRHLVYTGDEHHDGAQVVDIDNDGDLDIISIGWTHNRVVLYENMASAGTSSDTYTLGVNTVGSGAVLVNPAKTSYNPGETVQLTTQPAPGWAFDSWSGDLTGSANPATLMMVSDKNVTATFVETVGATYTLGVDTLGNGTVQVNPDKTSYNPGETVELTAQPAPGWIFNSWGSDLTSSANPITLVEDSDNPLEYTIQDNTCITATFSQDEYTLSVNTAGSGTVGIDPDQSMYFFGDIVTMTAAPDTGWSFDGWIGDVSASANPLEHTIQDDTTLSAIFSQDEHSLIVNTVGNGSVEIDPDQSAYFFGDVVTMTASDVSNWTFAEWSGDVSGSENPIKVTIQDDTTVTAVFTQETYSLTVNTVGNGSVDIDPDKSAYAYGDVVTMTAVADSSWVFTGWVEGISGNDNPKTITIQGNTDITAQFSTHKLFIPIITRPGS